MNADETKVKRQHAAESYAALASHIGEINARINKLKDEHENAQRQLQQLREELGQSVGSNIRERTFLIPGGRVVCVQHNVHGPSYADVRIHNIEQVI